MVSHPETGSDSPIGSDQDRGRDTPNQLRFRASSQKDQRPLTLKASPRTPTDFENQAPTSR